MMINQSATAILMGGPVELTIPAQHTINPKQNTKQDQPLGTRWEEARSGAEKKSSTNMMEDIIIEVYWDPKNGLWQFPLHHPV